MTAFATARATVEAITSGQSSAREICRAALDRIAARNPSLYAFHTVAAELALEQASALDARRGEWDRMPLLGVPVALKDNFCTRGLKTTAGSRILENYVPPY